MRAALLGTTALVAVSVLLVVPAAAQDTWLANPGSGDFNTGANWDNGTVPFGTAIFGASNTTTLTFSGNRNLDAFQFNPGAPAYTFDMTAGFGVRFSGDGIVNNSSNAPTFNVDGSLFEFTTDATAGNAIINLLGGTVTFLGNSTAGTAQLSAAAGSAFDFTGTTGPGGLGVITAGSIAGAGTFDGGTNSFIVGVANTSTDFSGSLTANSLTKVGTGTWTLSAPNTLLLSSTLTISAGTVVAASQTAGLIDAVGPGTPIILDGGTLAFGASGSFVNAVTFNADKTSILSAGTQLVSLDGSLVLGANATAQFGLAGDTGTIVFNTSPTVDTTNKVIVAGGRLQDSGNSLVGLTFYASTQVNAGAALDFNDSTNQAIRNLTGAGMVTTGLSAGTFLSLLVDDNTTSTWAGTISGSGHVEIESYTSAGGVMIFTGANTYTGGTTICFCSTLQLGTFATPGSIVGDVTVIGTLDIVNSDTSGITSITTDPGSLTIFRNSTHAGTAIIDNSGEIEFRNFSSASAADITVQTGGVIMFYDNATAGSATITNLWDVIFNNSSTAGSATFNNDFDGIIAFNDSATAGSATFNNSGEISFYDATSAGTAQFINSGSATMQFADTSTAASAQITLNDFSQLFFVDSATAGNATITNNGGFVSFGNSATAGNATISNTLGGVIQFLQTTNAGTAKITNEEGGTFFGDTASAANATIVNNFNGLTFFGATFGADTPTAANATITNNDGGWTTFQAASTAENAIITTNAGGATFFFDNANGGNAQFITNAGGIVDFSGTFGPGGLGQITAGSIAGAGDYYLGSNQLTVGSNNLSTEVSGTINDGISPLACGCGPPPTGASLVKVGTGTLTLSGVNTYTGPTDVNAGALVVNGSIVASSLLTVNSGTTVGGTGTLPTTIINAGATLSPGNSIGTIQVSGDLTFVGAGNYLVEVSPSAADRTNVTGAATLSGTVRAVFAPGVYVPQTSYVILSAAGGFGNTKFTDLVTVDAPALKPELEYTSTDVLLTLGVDFTAVLGLNINQTAVANAIQGFVNGGNQLPGPFLSLAVLPGALLPGALTQASGELATGSATAAFQSMDQFLNLMLDPFVDGRFGVTAAAGGPALSFAPQSAVQAALPAELLGYDAIVRKAPPMAVPFERRWTAWGAAYGGAGTFDGDPVIGSNNVRVRNGAFATGVDYRVSPDTVIGGAVSGGALRYDLNGINGSGRGETLQAGFYGSTRFADAGYLSAALAFARHEMSTERTILFPGIADRLTADFDATSWGGRVETGYRFALANFGVTPYAAVQSQVFETAAYSERDTSGLAGGFALNYLSRSTTDTRSELGARFDYRALMDGALLTLRARAAWGHEFDTDRSIDAVFQSLPGFGFTVTGAAAPRDVALVSAGAEVKWRNGISLSAKFDGEFSGRTEVYAGSAALRWSW